MYHNYNPELCKFYTAINEICDKSGYHLTHRSHIQSSYLLSTLFSDSFLPSHLYASINNLEFLRVLYPRTWISHPVL